MPEPLRRRQRDDRPRHARAERRVVGRILWKLGLRDRVQAVILAYEAGIVRPGGLR